MRRRPTARSPGDAASSSGRPMPSPVSREQLRHSGRRPKRVAHGARDRAASRVRRRGARPRARDRARTRRLSRSVVAQALLVDEKADGVEPRYRSGADRAAGLRAAPQARARRLPSRCGRWRRAGCPACRPRSSGSIPGSRGSQHRSAGASRNRIFRGGRNTGLRPICVSSTYFSSAPIAASSARVKSPKPPSSATLNCCLQVRLARRGCRNRPPAPASPPRRRARSSA